MEAAYDPLVPSSSQPNFVMSDLLGRAARHAVENVRRAFDPPGLRGGHWSSLARDLARGRVIICVGALGVLPFVRFPHRTSFVVVVGLCFAYSAAALLFSTHLSSPLARAATMLCDIAIAGAMGRAFPAVRPAALVTLILSVVMYTALGGWVAGVVVTALTGFSAYAMEITTVNVVLVMVLGIAGVMMIGDVTAHERDALSEWQRAEAALREHVKLYERVLTAQSDLGEGFLIAEEGRCVYANDAYCRITGYSLDELRALESLLDIATPEERATIVGRMKQRMAGEAALEHYEAGMIRKDGARIVLEVAHKPLMVDGKRRNITLVRDVTERKRVEEALRLSEQRYADAYAREREVAERLRALDELKNGFLSAVSHELRTPLTSVLGFAQTLRDHDQDLAADMRASVLERMTANANKLNMLLSDLLDVDRARRGILEPKLQRVRIDETLSAVAHEWEQSSGRQVFVDGSALTVSVDPAKVERITENLLSNAGKYSTGRIWLRFWRRDDGVVIVVDDEGPGVPEELKRSVFEPFMRAGTGSEHAPGTGIGLSLVTQFTRIHGGHAWVEDRAGGGASFRVFLPDAQTRLHTVSA
jgi:PAS domain S-box-containing protein